MNRNRRAFEDENDIEGGEDGRNKFVWHKKKKNEEEEGLSLIEAERRSNERKEIAAIELERLEQRKKEREAYISAKQEDKRKEFLSNDTEEREGWKAKEEEYHLEISKERALARIRDMRGTTTDYIVFNIAICYNPERFAADSNMRLESPSSMILREIQTDPALDELMNDCEFFINSEKRNSIICNFWKNLFILCEFRRKDLDIIYSKSRNRHKQENSADLEDDPESDRRVVVDESVIKSINEMLFDKTFFELSELHSQIEEQLRSDDPGDIEYWEHMLKRILYYKTEVKVKEFYEILLRKHSNYLLDQIYNRNNNQEEDEEGEEDLEEIQRLTTKLKLENKIKDGEAAALGGGTPKIIQELEDFVRILLKKLNRGFDQQVAGQDLDAGKTKLDPARLKSFQPEDNDVDFTEELPLPYKEYGYGNDVILQKPKYFNRMRQGFEWNKYNQTHHSYNNPPPRVVLGYKFNIFYPDLEDKSISPTYRVVKDAKDKHSKYATLIFSAGSPYEDIAFKIVSKEWEYASRRGFRSNFDRGILSLHFHFKR